MPALVTSTTSPSENKGEYDMLTPIRCPVVDRYRYRYGRCARVVPEGLTWSTGRPKIELQLSRGRLTDEPYFAGLGLPPA